VASVPKKKKKIQKRTANSRDQFEDTKHECLRHSKPHLKLAMKLFDVPILGKDFEDETSEVCKIYLKSPKQVATFQLHPEVNYS
jgi:hypothetical protein